MPSKTGSWQLDATDRKPEDLDAQIEEILGKLTPSLDVWQDLSRHYKIDLFCGFFMQVTNEGLEISVKSLEALSQRGILLSICLYAPLRQDSAERRDA